MNLDQDLKEAQERLDTILSNRKELINAFQMAKRALDRNTEMLTVATKKTDSIRAMMSVIPPTVTVSKRAYNVNEDLKENRHDVYAALKKIPNVWVSPRGLAVLSGVDAEVTAAILRNAASLPGIPVEHNGRRARASKYRWVGEK